MSDLPTIEQSVADATRVVNQRRSLLSTRLWNWPGCSIRFWLKYSETFYCKSLAAFRTTYHRIGIWPVTLIVCGPFAAGAFGLLVGSLVAASTLLMCVLAATGTITAIVVCTHLLYLPRDESLYRRISILHRDLDELRTQLIAHKSAAKQARHDLNDAKHRLQSLQSELTRKRQEARQLELLRSKQYQLEQLFSRDWRSMRGVEFEDFLEQVFILRGLRVETTKASGDQGVDLIVTNGHWRIAIQVKGYSDSVSNKAVQEAHTGMTFYDCNGSVVITNSQFTKSAIEIASTARCKLIGEDQIRDLVVGDLFDRLFPVPNDAQIGS